MRIGLYPHGTGSGIETYCRELAPQLSKAGIEPVAIGSVEPSSDAVEWVETPAPSTSIPLSRQRTAGQQLEEGLSGTSIDVLHLSNPSVLPFVDDPPPTVATAWFHPPSFLGGLMTAYQSYPHPLRELPLRVARRGVLQILDRQGYRAAADIVAVTSELQTALNRHEFDASNIPPGIASDNMDTWTPDPDGSADLLFVASSVSNTRKNFDGLLDIAHVLVREQGVDAVVHVAGSPGIHERRLVRDRSLDDVVKFHGHVPRRELFELYSQCDCLLAPSRYEEFGYAVLEALSHGVPVVGSDIHAFRDLLGDGAGVLSTPADPAAFASDVHSLLNDESTQRRLSKAAVNRVETRYQWASIVPQLTDVYESALTR